ncbi:hypothetical protein BC938DRAFT_479005 [Jimgerdemannia flammicorona]|uniref:Cyanocobalamin reductase (cyanide-eliminating) n=1 Tax=Jimgerdemannia flammicorona TaxID=994334 RepID=A0A433QLV5_9FUNG|nr:hypothetical protein BC938DRAFT_479005 [Jimgerdemannia flammicorona]
MMHYREITKAFAEGLLPLGFDLVSAFPVQRYNTSILPTYRLPTFGRESTPSTPSTPTTLGILVANTRHLWPIFLRHLRNRDQAGDSWEADSDPLDKYTRATVERAAVAVLSPGGIRFEIRYSDMAERQVVAFQRLAHETAGIYYNEKCHLNVHEKFGAWIALRAVVVIDHPGPANTSALFPSPFNPYPSADSLLEDKTTHLRSVIASSDSGAKAGISRNWRAWVELRDLASGFLDEEARRSYGSRMMEPKTIDPKTVDQVYLSGLQRANNR